MATTNPPITRAGAEVAVGPGNVTITPSGYAAWVIADTITAAQAVNQKHQFLPNDDRSMTLTSGENLYLFGDCSVAVTFTATA